MNSHLWPCIAVSSQRFFETSAHFINNTYNATFVAPCFLPLLWGLAWPPEGRGGVISRRNCVKIADDGFLSLACTPLFPMTLSSLVNIQRWWASTVTCTSLRSNRHIGMPLDLGGVDKRLYKQNKLKIDWNVIMRGMDGASSLVRIRWRTTQLNISVYLLSWCVLQKVETNRRVAIHHGPDSDPLKIFGQISRQSQRRLHGSGEERHAEIGSSEALNEQSI